MQNVSNIELVGLFEDIMNNDEKIDSLKNEQKAYKKSSKDEMEAFAKEKEISVKDLNQAYKYYKDKVNSSDGKSDCEDFFTLCSIVDSFDELDDNAQ